MGNKGVDFAIRPLPIFLDLKPSADVAGRVADDQRNLAQRIPQCLDRDL